MKRMISTALCVICVVIGLSLLLAGCFYYETNCKETRRDASISPNGDYELVLIEIGEPQWPFGPASGQLILKQGDTPISQTDFEIKNDGGRIGSDCWAVTWNEDHVEVILSGEEQLDEQILLLFDGTIQRQTLIEETEPPTTEPETLDIEVMENREKELVFTISIDDYIRGYNSCYEADYGRGYLTPSVEWKCNTYDSAIHSPHETLSYYFTEDEKIYSLPTITVYVPTNGDYIQEVTVNFDEHSYSESGFEQYKEMCFYTLKVFFPDLTDETILDLCAQAITLGNQNAFTSDEWYSSESVPYALFYQDGIGVYPYFAIGDWEYLCIIPVTEETIAELAQKDVKIYEIQ